MKVDKELEKKLGTLTSRVLDAIVRGKTLVQDIADPWVKAMLGDITQQDPWLLERGGLFFTLKKEGKLRGCMGRIDAGKPYHELFLPQILSTAREDPRFSPLKLEERTEGLTGSFTFLEEPYEIASWKEWQLGKQGVILELTGRRALYLPNVPLEQGWDEQTTLMSLCRKAGLPAEAWQNPAAVYHVFSGTEALLGPV